MKDTIKQLIEKAVLSLKKESDFEMPVIEVDYPKNEAFGDFTTNVALSLGRLIKKNPLEIAEKIVELLKNGSSTSIMEVELPAIFEKIEVVAPGYINFHLSAKYLQGKVAEINRLKEEFGNAEMGKRIK
jgi:arginyl-tRNA synthetase